MPVVLKLQPFQQMSKIVDVFGNRQTNLHFLNIQPFMTANLNSVAKYECTFYSSATKKSGTRITGISVQFGFYVQKLLIITLTSDIINHKTH